MGRYSTIHTTPTMIHLRPARRRSEASACRSLHSQSGQMIIRRSRRCLTPRQLLSLRADCEMANSARNSVKDLLEKGSVVIMLGTGGVGKTTVAAALGIAAAGARINTALITVDPAKRLRDALGLERLGGRPKGLGTARLKAA